jgi:hypothetical protein
MQSDDVQRATKDVVRASAWRATLVSKPAKPEKRASVFGTHVRRTSANLSNIQDSSHIDTVVAIPLDRTPLRNPTNPGRSENPDDGADDSIDIARVRDLIAAAAALTPAGGPLGVLLGEALKAIEPRARAPEHGAVAASASTTS